MSRETKARDLNLLQRAAEAFCGILESGGSDDERIYDSEERSFTIIAFPVPQIGEDFEAIFDKILEIITLDFGDRRFSSVSSTRWTRRNGYGSKAEIKIVLI